MSSHIELHFEKKKKDLTGQSSCRPSFPWIIRLRTKVAAIILKWSLNTEMIQIHCLWTALKFYFFWFDFGISLCPEGLENIQCRHLGADPHFSNQNDLRNPKMGSNQSFTVPPYKWFFQITFLGTKKHQKNWTVSLLINSPIIYMP